MRLCVSEEARIRRFLFLERKTQTTRKKPPAKKVEDLLDFRVKFFYNVRAYIKAVTFPKNIHAEY